jgi:hypothetical protein
MGLFDNLTEIERSKELHSQACFQDTEPSERGRQQTHSTSLKRRMPCLISSSFIRE